MYFYIHVYEHTGTAAKKSHNNERSTSIISSLDSTFLVFVNMSEAPGWASQPSGGGGSARKQASVRNKSSAPPTPTGDETTDRTAVVSAQLKRIYKKAVLPVEKRYQYDYFFDSPLLTDVEFDGRSWRAAGLGDFITLAMLLCRSF